LANLVVAPRHESKVRLVALEYGWDRHELWQQCGVDLWIRGQHEPAI
jgi:hypothetical protein